METIINKKTLTEKILCTVGTQLLINLGIYLMVSKQKNDTTGIYGLDGP